MTFFSLEQHIATHKPVRFNDAFVAEQLSQFNATRKSKWRTQPDHTGVRHQTYVEYFRRTRFDCPIQELEIALQDKVLSSFLNNPFKAFSKSF